MILADFLSRIVIDDGDPSEIIPVSFDCLTILKDHFNHFLNKFLIATRKTTEKSGIKLPEVHGISKILNPHKKPEHQKTVPIIPQNSHPNPIFRSTISSTQIASRNFIKKRVKQLHKNQKPIKQSKMTPTNNIDSQMNDDATLVPTNNTHISRRPNQRLKQSNRPPVDTDNTDTPIDLITPSNVQEIEKIEILH